MKFNLKDKIKPETWRVLFVAVLIILVICVGRNQMCTESLVGKHLYTMTTDIYYAADLLEAAETELDQHLIWETLYNSLYSTSESLETVVKGQPFLKVYGEEMEELTFYILRLRSEYKDKDIAFVVEDLRRIADAIEETGIRDIVDEDIYSYVFDNAGVKDMLKEIRAAGKLEV